VSLETLNLSAKGHLGLAAQAEFTLVEGQRVTFVLRIVPEHKGDGRSCVDEGQAELLGVDYHSEHLWRSHIRLMVMVTCRADGGCTKVEVKGGPGHDQCTFW
jgi:hypothetical protein